MKRFARFGPSRRPAFTGRSARSPGRFYDMRLRLQQPNSQEESEGEGEKTARKGAEGKPTVEPTG